MPPSVSKICVGAAPNIELGTSITMAKVLSPSKKSSASAGGKKPSGTATPYAISLNLLKSKKTASLLGPAKKLIPFSFLINVSSTVEILTK